MTTRVRTSKKLEGPFFTRQPGRTFRENERELLRAVVTEGERDVVGQLCAGESGRAPIRMLGGDRVRQYVAGRIHSIGGSPWALTGVVSVNSSGLNRAEGISLLAAAARLEARTKAFKRTTSRIRRSRAANLDELLNGIR